MAPEPRGVLGSLPRALVSVSAPSLRFKPGTFTCPGTPKNCMQNRLFECSPRLLLGAEEVHPFICFSVGFRPPKIKNHPSPSRAPSLILDARWNIIDFVCSYIYLQNQFTVKEKTQVSPSPGTHAQCQTICLFQKFKGKLRHREAFAAGSGSDSRLETGSEAQAPWILN